ncbi:hypothetical protein EG68_01118 [Paragonimus skrjabini miyazakii]|uniref:Anaphase-promoting complex subunit 5 n=1 Tax=Paragonimus skrjabini miyazakii TaxID=59628 RepID=A0A8S9Z965_9TREM|nr:hypothetical protein EG68_01118 [Paragonimus skrjabini miyazakii]
MCDAFFGASVFADSVTHTNLVLFILLKEYICSLRLDEVVFYDDDVTRVDMYMYLYNMLKNTCAQPFECIKQGSKLLPLRLQALAHGRIDRLRDIFEAVNFTHPSSVNELLFSGTISLEDDKFLATKESVFGLFLRRFSLGFHQRSFEGMSQFLGSFLKAYDKYTEGQVRVSSLPLDPLHFTTSSTRNHTLETSLRIADSMGQLGGRPTTDVKQLDETLSQFKRLFPNLPAPYYASHLLATRKRNLTEGERNLLDYFETRMSSEKSEKNLSNICAYMAVAAANMHLSFGHWFRGRCLEKEALKKALESESKSPLSHVRITHNLLNANTEPFRYDGHISYRNLNRSTHVVVTELRTKFWSMIDSGAHPADLLTLYFNSPVAMAPIYFTVYLLDLATMWLVYGYPVLHTTLLQCVINADCLQPCPVSDAVLSTAFAGMIMAFNAAGAVKQALQLTRSAEAVLYRFAEKSAFLRASLQVELDQALRSRIDMSHCDRLVNALRLFCPWEATLYQAEVERCRGNTSASHDLLQHVIDDVTCRLRDTTACTDSRHLAPKRPDPTDFLSHFEMPTLNGHIPVGGLVRLVQIGVRAQLALVELFLSIGMFTQAEAILDNARCWTNQYKLYAAETSRVLLHQAVAIAQSTFVEATLTDMDDALSQLLHQSDVYAQQRGLVFASRLRLHAMSGDSQRKVFLQSHLERLWVALEFFRSVDDRRRILDVLVLLATALNSSGHVAERNEVAQAFIELREKYRFGAGFNSEEHISVL